MAKIIKQLLKLIGIWLMILAILIPLFIKKRETMTKKVMAKEVNVYLKHEKKYDTQEKYDYIAVLEIPKIKLKQGLIDKNSKYNNIKYNIQILDESVMPNIDNSNLFLAAHNGNSNVSFFNGLDKLALGDTIYLYYNRNKYTYILNDTYEVAKTGMVRILRDENKTTLTLITCKGGDDTKQVVYIGYLSDVTSY